VARIRTVKPEFFESDTLAKVSRDSRLTFIGLFTLADDLGRLRYLPKKLAGELFPLDDDVTYVEIEKWIDELEAIDCVRVYEVKGKTYIHLPEWEKHQRIDHPSVSRIPEPLANLSRKSREDVAPGSRNLDLGSRNLDLGSARPEAAPQTPTPEPEPNPAPKVAAKPKTKRKTQFPDDFVFTEDMRDWPTSQRAVQQGAKLEDEFEKFRDWHTAKGSIMQDWRAAFRTWLRNYRPGGGGGYRAPPSVMDELREIYEAEIAKEQVVDTTGVETPRMGELGWS
jgi:hypothetical protein